MSNYYLATRMLVANEQALFSDFYEAIIYPLSQNGITNITVNEGTVGGSFDTHDWKTIRDPSKSQSFTLLADCSITGVKELGFKDTKKIYNGTLKITVLYKLPGGINKSRNNIISGIKNSILQPKYWSKKPDNIKSTWETIRKYYTQNQQEFTEDGLAGTLLKLFISDIQGIQSVKRFTNEEIERLTKDRGFLHSTLQSVRNYFSNIVPLWGTDDEELAALLKELHRPALTTFFDSEDEFKQQIKAQYIAEFYTQPTDNKEAEHYVSKKPTSPLGELPTIIYNIIAATQPPTVNTLEFAELTADDVDKLATYLQYVSTNVNDTETARYIAQEIIKIKEDTLSDTSGQLFNAAILWAVSDESPFGGSIDDMAGFLKAIQLFQKPKEELEDLRGEHDPREWDSIVATIQQTLTAGTSWQGGPKDFTRFVDEVQAVFPINIIDQYIAMRKAGDKTDTYGFAPEGIPPVSKIRYEPQQGQPSPQGQPSSQEQPSQQDQEELPDPIAPDKELKQDLELDQKGPSLMSDIYFRDTLSKDPEALAQVVSRTLKQFKNTPNTKEELQSYVTETVNNIMLTMQQYRQAFSSFDSEETKAESPSEYLKESHDEAVQILSQQVQFDFVSKEFSGGGMALSVEVPVKNRKVTVKIPNPIYAANVYNLAAQAITQIKETMENPSTPQTEQAFSSNLTKILDQLRPKLKGNDAKVAVFDPPLGEPSRQSGPAAYQEDAAQDQAFMDERNNTADWNADAEMPSDIPPKNEITNDELTELYTDTYLQYYELKHTLEQTTEDSARQQLLENIDKITNRLVTIYDEITFRKKYENYYPGIVTPEVPKNPYKTAALITALNRALKTLLNEPLISPDILIKTMLLYNPL